MLRSEHANENDKIRNNMRQAHGDVVTCTQQLRKGLCQSDALADWRADQKYCRQCWRMHFGIDAPFPTSLEP